MNDTTTTETATSALSAVPDVCAVFGGTSSLLGHLRLFYKILNAAPGSPLYPTTERISELGTALHASNDRDDAVRVALELLDLVFATLLDTEPPAGFEDEEAAWRQAVLDEGRAYVALARDAIMELACDEVSTVDNAWFAQLCDRFDARETVVIADRVVGICLLVAAELRLERGQSLRHKLG